MTRILFVCHGNICRSPMAEYIMKRLVEEAGASEAYHIESAGTSEEELGHSVWGPARTALAAHDIRCSGHRARRVQAGEYGSFDLIVGMDHANTANLLRLFGGDPEGRIRLLGEFGPGPVRPIEDPWPYGDFEAVYTQIEAGCRGLLEYASRNLSSLCLF